MLDWSVSALVHRGEVHESWADALHPVEPTLTRLARTLEGTPFLPEPADVFRALRQPASQVRVVLLGQDPYPTPGHAMGLAFSVRADVRPLPGSLRNVFRELQSDAGVPVPATGDLTAWANAGVLLLNRTLTVQPATPLAHRRLGWHEVTDAVLRHLVDSRRADSGQPLVLLLWGREAGQAASFAEGHAHVRVVESVHPSPLSASRGFFGSRPFSRTNAALAQLGSGPVDWSLPT